ncbi:hypothetical protein B0A48_09753 [Cryoendolithus antarcticus]|uniref:Uncharacterized protein n=1 Tax=Cryoendolithus antarcticus TaxID=1507870 RepID=A0A1V8T324_9PEZI|nr:hypothetical protein B0A48_09753 [Cryoendolithus antarcticus]
MSLFKRLSDSIVALVSPSKTRLSPTPESAPVAKQPSRKSRKRSFQEYARGSRSMSPAARVDTWLVDDQDRGPHQLQTPSISGTRGLKLRREEDLSEDRMEVDEEHSLDTQSRSRAWQHDHGVAARAHTWMDSEDYEGDQVMDLDSSEGIQVRGEGFDGENELDGSSVGNELYDSSVEEGNVGDAEEVMNGVRTAIGVHIPPPDTDSEISSLLCDVHVHESDLDELDDSDVDVDLTNVVDEATYIDSTPKRNKIPSLPTQQEALGVSDAELRAAGFDDDHIILVQKIKMRGHEALLPSALRYSLRHLPDALFATDNTTSISSVRGLHANSENALNRLIDTASYARDAILAGCRTRPEIIVLRRVREYLRWAMRDSQLEQRTLIPLLTVIAKPADTPHATLETIATHRLEKLATRYREAFLVHPSSERSSPISQAGVQYSYPTPTLYGIIASYTIVALVAYTPHDEVRKITPMAFFDLTQVDYDVWNALALAIVVCHVRSVLVRIAEETGLGLKVPGQFSEEEDSDL